MFPLLLGNSRRCLPLYTKIISSLVRKVLGIAKACISPGSHEGAEDSAVFVAGISLLSIM